LFLLAISDVSCNSANWASAAWRSSTISGCDDVGLGEIGAVFEAFVSEPADVEAELVALQYGVHCNDPSVFDLRLRC
jgi:hypothetical protein